MTTKPHQLTKRFLDEHELVVDSFRLGVQIFESGFKPDFIVGLWRGGSIVGMYVQECLQTLGVTTDHIAVRTSYRGMEHYSKLVASPETEIRVHGTDFLIDRLNAEDRLLIVDDAYSSGHSVAAVLDRLRKQLKRNMPCEARVATLYSRPSANQTGLLPDYCLHSTENWLVFPYEMNGLTRDELDHHKPFLTPILDSVGKHP